MATKKKKATGYVIFSIKSGRKLSSHRTLTAARKAAKNKKSCVIRNMKTNKFVSK